MIEVCSISSHSPLNGFPWSGSLSQGGCCGQDGTCQSRDQQDEGADCDLAGICFSIFLVGPLIEIQPWEECWEIKAVM